MMATGPVDGIQGNSLGINDFLKILLTQLSFQDPLKPIDNAAFVAQLAQFSALQATQELNTKIDTLTQTQATLQSVSLLGKTIDLDSSGGLISGTIAAVAFNTGVPLLTVTTTSGGTINNVRVTQIVQIH